MRIDLHLHTPISKKNGDTIVWYSLFDTLTKLRNFNIKVAAFTDHNSFDLNLYLQAKELFNKINIKFFPGVELDVKPEAGSSCHLLIIFNDKLNEEQLKNLSLKINSLSKSGLSINEVNSWCEEYETIRIPHVGKNDCFKYEDLLKIKYDAFEVTNLNHQNYLSVIKKGLVSSVVAFSDTHSWKKYPQESKLYTYIDGLENVDFESLKKAFSEKKNFVKEW